MGEINLEKPLVSIIIPVYNMGDMLENSVKSAAAQTYDNVEILLIDDGSKDDSLKVCERIAQRDSRVKVFHQENKGSGPARNLGIENASGKYVYFFDADDAMEKNAIEILVKNLETEKCDMVVFGYRMLHPDGREEVYNAYPGKVFGGEYVRSHYDIFLNRAKMYIQGAPWNKMFSLEKIKEHGIKYPALRRNQDEVFIMMYVDIADRILLIDDVLYNHYPNDIHGAFKKFPLDFFDIVSRVNEYRYKYMYGWNEENKRVLEIICSDFLNGTNKSMMLLFNPKWGLSFKERYSKIKDIAQRCVEEMPDKNYNTDSTLYSLMKKKRYVLLYFAAYLAIFKNKKYIR